jgi:integrase
LVRLADSVRHPWSAPLHADDSDRALWATAFYGGLRRGELRALRVTGLDLRAGLIHVRRGWADVDGEQGAKSAKARRAVPIIGPLRPVLREHLLRTGRRGDDLVFGETATVPFNPTAVRARAREAWQAAELEPYTMHSARHHFASALMAAGVDILRVAQLMGHADTRRPRRCTATCSRMPTSGRSRRSIRGSPGGHRRPGYGRCEAASSAPSAAQGHPGGCGRDRRR